MSEPRRGLPTQGPPARRRTGAGQGDAVDLSDQGPEGDGDHPEPVALESETQRFRLFMQRCTTPMACATVDGRFLEVNAAGCSFHGRERDDMLVRRWQDLAHPDDRERMQDCVAEILAGTIDHATEHMRFVRPTGSVVSCTMTVVGGRDAAGQVAELMIQLTDLTAEHSYRDALAVERELRRAELLYRTVVANLAEGVVIHTDGHVVDANPAAQRILGVSLDRMDHMHGRAATTYPRTLRSDGSDFPTSEHPSAVATRTGLPVRGVVMGLEHPGAEPTWILINSLPLPEPDGEVRTVVTSFTDITALKAAEQQLVHQAMHDSLTGLPNRALLLEHVSAALRRHDRTGVPLAVVFVDLDGFKAVNDEAGHLVGDEILRVVSTRLVRALRASDIAGRFGGDEFLIICEGVADESQLAALAQRILYVIPQPVTVDNVAHTVGASIGVARATRGTSPDELVQRADAAMYEAKRLGGSRFVSL